MLDSIDAHRTKLRKSERKVADYVLAYPNEAIRSSLTVLAETIGVSQPTVIRFCRAIGCQGFQDFKLNLAQNLSGRARYFHQQLVANDIIEQTASSSVFDHTIAQLVNVRNHLSRDSESFQQAVTLIAQASRIEFYGVGMSAITALDGQHKFIRLGMGIPCTVYSDAANQRIAATALKPGAVAIVCSISGRCPEILQIATLAAQTGAKVIAVTAKDSPLAQQSHVTLTVGISPIDSEDYTLFTERIAHLVILDALGLDSVRQRRSESVL